MGKVIRDLIEYTGIDTCSYKDLSNFKQMNIDYVFCIPNEKPDIEQILRVGVEGCILDTKVVTTPVGTSYEGQNVTGTKIMVTGDMELKIQYVACNAVQSVHSATTKFPISGYIVIPGNVNPNAIITPGISIEDIFTDQMDCRCIYANITFMITSSIC